MVVGVSMQSQRLKAILFVEVPSGGKIYAKILGSAQDSFRERRRILDGILKNPTEPMKGVTIESSYSLFGYWDYAIFFKADTNDNALHFVGEKLRAIDGIAETSTSPMTILKEHK